MIKTLTTSVLPQHIIAVTIEEHISVPRVSLSHRLVVVLKLVDGSRYIYADCESQEDAILKHIEARLGIDSGNTDLFANVTHRGVAI